MSDFKAKMHQIRYPLGLCQRPRWGSLQRSPDPLAVFRGLLLRRGGRESERRGGNEEGREGKCRALKIITVVYDVVSVGKLSTVVADWNGPFLGNRIYCLREPSKIDSNSNIVEQLAL